MGLLASVDTRVYGQSRTLNELLATSWVVAHVGTDATVDTLCRGLALTVVETTESRTMTSQIAAAGKTLAAC